MRFQLQPGEKPNIDKLGPGYVSIRPEAITGTFIWQHAAKTAKNNLFKSGYGLPHLTTEDCEVRVYPSQQRIAFAWGKHIGGGLRITANVYRYDAKMREQLEGIGLIPRTGN